MAQHECAAPRVLLEYQNGVHLDLRTLWQCGNADGCACRVRLFEVLAHDLVDLGEVAQVNEIMGKYFEQPYPARAAIGVAALPKGAQVEMDAILVIE